MNHAAPGALRRRLIASGLAGRGRRTRLHRMRLRRLRWIDRRRGRRRHRSASRSSSRPPPTRSSSPCRTAPRPPPRSWASSSPWPPARRTATRTPRSRPIENAISKGDAGILITPNGPGVEDALVKARDAGLYVIALDTPPADPESVDITFATDNFLAGQKIGEWTAAKLDGEKATIAMIDLFDDKVVSVDYNRDQGFLDGMGIDLADDDGERRRGGDRHATAAATTRSSATRRRRAPRTAAAPRRRRCSRRTPTSTSSTRSTSPPPTARTRRSRPPAATDDVIVVSVDGGCAGIDAVKDGIIGATSQQYPVKMAELGVQAIVDLVADGRGARDHRGPRLLQHRRRARDRRARRTASSRIDTAEAADICWG